MASGEPAPTALGNFWVDLVRGTLRILLPIAVLATLVLVALGAVQNLRAGIEVTTLTGQSQTITGGPVASQEAIKELGTNGGGFYNVNSAHPFENPTPVSNLVEIFLLLLIPVALTRTFGRHGRRHAAGVRHARRDGRDLGGAARRGDRARGVTPGYGVRARRSVDGGQGDPLRRGRVVAVRGVHHRHRRPERSTPSTPRSPRSRGGLLLLNMGLGEVAPGGVGSGLYGMLVLAILAVFVAGLMVGRTPEYLRKKIRAREMKLVALYILTMPVVVLAGTGVSMALPGPRESILNPGPHGLSEVLYAFMSAGNNNGSAFAGLSVNTAWYNTVLGLTMLFVRFLPIVLVLALAGSLAGQQHVPATAGTLPTHRPLFVGMLTGVVVVVAGLTFFPVLALGPLAEGLS